MSTIKRIYRSNLFTYEGYTLVLSNIMKVGPVVGNPEQWAFSVYLTSGHQHMIEFKADKNLAEETRGKLITSLEIL